MIQPQRSLGSLLWLMIPPLIGMIIGITSLLVANDIAKRDNYAAFIITEGFNLGWLLIIITVFFMVGAAVLAAKFPRLNKFLAPLTLAFVLLLVLFYDYANEPIGFAYTNWLNKNRGYETCFSMKDSYRRTNKWIYVSARHDVGCKSIATTAWPSSIHELFHFVDKENKCFIEFEKEKPNYYPKFMIVQRCQTANN